MDNILVLSAGRRVSLVRGFQSVIAADKSLNLRVFTADMNPQLSSACQVSDGCFQLPHVLDDSYPEALMLLCKSKEIRLVIPTIDTELPILSALRIDFLEQGIELIVSSEDLVADCADKRKTKKLFSSYCLPTPEIYDKKSLKYPLLVKPYDGSLSSGIIIVESEDQITNQILDNPKNVFCQYINHDKHSEFTVDLYYDRNSQLRCVVPRKRIAVRGGEVAKALAERNEIVESLFQSLGVLKGARGCLTLQLFRNNETFAHWYIEINARFGGGYPLSRHAGADFQSWLIKEYIQGKNIPTYNEWRDNTLMLRYDAEVIMNV